MNIYIVLQKMISENSYRKTRRIKSGFIFRENFYLESIPTSSFQLFN